MDEQNEQYSPDTADEGSVAVAERRMMTTQEIAERAKAAGIEACLFDRGGYLYHGRVKSLADGAREGGLKF